MSLENDILIDNYLRGLLDDNEMADFKLRLESDDEFRKNFELERALWFSQNETDWSFVTHKSDEVKIYKRLLEDQDLQDLKKNLKQINAEFSESSVKSTRPKFYYYAAASVVILICLSIFLRQDVSNQDLVNDYLNSSDLPSFVTRGETFSNELIKAQQLFESQGYHQALDIFTQEIETNDKNASIYLYTGLSQMKLKKYAEAELTFDKLIDSDLLDAQKGYWYKALLYLEQDKLDESKIVLNTIVSKSLYNYANAKELLIKLNDD